jgi:hypothetical protein
MSYRFPTSSDRFVGDMGAGNEHTGYPIFVMLHFRFPTEWDTGGWRVMCGLSAAANDNEPSSLMLATNPQADFRVQVYHNGLSSANVLTGDAGTTTQWRHVICRRLSTTGPSPEASRLWTNNNTDSYTPVSQVLENLRYLRVGSSFTGSNNVISTTRLAGFTVGFFDLEDVADAAVNLRTISPLTVFAGRDDYWYYSFAEAGSTIVDSSGNGGPSLTAVGSPVYEEDHPYTEPLANPEFIPYMPALYRGGMLLNNRSNIQYAVLPGHSSLAGGVMASGNDGTTNEDGIFQLPSPIIDPEVDDEDPVTVKLHWTEGSDPELSHSVVHKTILTEAS